MFEGVRHKVGENLVKASAIPCHNGWFHAIICHGNIAIRIVHFHVLNNTDCDTEDIDTLVLQWARVIHPSKIQKILN